MKLSEKLQDLLEVIKTEEEAFFTKGKKVAGTRLRKALQETILLSKEGRKLVTETKNAKA